MLFKKKSKARIKADAQIKQLKGQHRDLDRKLALFFLMTILLALLWFGLPFILCLHLLSVWKRPVHEAFIAAVVLGLIFPFLFTEHIRRLASYGENIAAEYKMRKWLKRRGKRPQPASKKD